MESPISPIADAPAVIAPQPNLAAPADIAAADPVADCGMPERSLHRVEPVPRCPQGTQTTPQTLRQTVACLGGRYPPLILWQTVACLSGRFRLPPRAAPRETLTPPYAREGRWHGIMRLSRATAWRHGKGWLAGRWSQ